MKQNDPKYTQREKELMDTYWITSYGKINERSTYDQDLYGIMISKNAEDPHGYSSTLLKLKPQDINDLNILLKSFKTDPSDNNSFIRKNEVYRSAKSIKKTVKRKVIKKCKCK
jgi:hypothetical protein